MSGPRETHGPAVLRPAARPPCRRAYDRDREWTVAWSWAVLRQRRRSSGFLASGPIAPRDLQPLRERCAPASTRPGRHGKRALSWLILQRAARFPSHLTLFALRRLCYASCEPLPRG